MSGDMGIGRIQILEMVERGEISPEVGSSLLRQLAQRPATTVAPASGSSDEVAIVGLSGRFPDAPTVDDLWANLLAGHDSVREMPPERWNVEEHFDPDPRAQGKTYSKWGAVLEGIDQFDPDFFGISPREACLMDPQQRIFLMEAWRALEDAGYSDRAVDGAGCHVFVGAGAGDYYHLLQRRGVPLEGYTFMGTHPAVLASRISYYLNLQGPSVTIDTSCSSSLMAIHLACEAIRDGRCQLALAGGVAALVTPDLHILASKAGMLSPRGQCRAFDDSADGFVPGEAVGVVILKSLEQARRDGDFIYGVIAASGANQDGKTSGITAPSGPAQTALMVETYERFGIDPADIGYVECHGTGTRLGDPIEIDGLTKAFSRFTSARQYCAVGSIKSNLGHTLTAAGVSGLIKALLCIRHRRLVPSLHVDQLNSYIDFAGSPFYVNTEVRPWDARPGSPRMAAVSSFGFSGTNVHAVVREAPELQAPAADDTAQPRLYVVSAKGEEPLRERLEELSGWLGRTGGDFQGRDVAYTLGAGRAHFPHRAAFVAREPGELRQRIDALLYQGVVQNGDYGALSKFAETYRSGDEVDWDELFRGESCHRVPLPSYPFTRGSYWVPEGGARRGKIEPVARAEKTTPRKVAGSPSEPLVLRRFLEPTDPVIRDHVVLGRPLLPAAGHLSIVRSLLREVFGEAPVILSRVVFLRPIFVEASLEIEVVIEPLGPELVSFQLRGASSEARPEIYGRGQARLATGEPPAGLAIGEILDRCPETLESEVHYARFRADGIAYGPQFETVRQIRYGSSEALASLVRADDPDPLPPGLLDGALQSAAVLEWGNTGVSLPFAMEGVHVLRPVPAESWAHVQKLKPGECKITIADRQGQPCVVIEEFSYRELAQPVTTELYVPGWRVLEPLDATAAGNEETVASLWVVTTSGDRGLGAALAARHPSASVTTVHLDRATGAEGLEAALAQAPDPDRIYFLGGFGGPDFDPDALDALDRQQELGVRSLFRLVKTLLGRGCGERPLALTVVTEDVHAVRPDDVVRPDAGSLFGLCRSLAKEQTEWGVRCLDVARREIEAPASADCGSVVEAIVREPAQEQGEEVALREGQRYFRELQRAARTAPSEAPYRQGGTFLILGGAGGIGAELAKHLARRVGGRSVLLGRSPISPRINDTLREVEEAGGEAIYLNADAGDEASLAAAVSAAKARFGDIHGAFHSALVLRDARLETMDESTFEAALTPKIRGTAVLVKALRNEPLDFLAFFSSAQSFSGNPGQSNYSAACTFKDAFGHALRRAGRPVRIVNWGYWGEVGIVSEARYRRRMKAIGVHSISTEEGMEALEKILGHEISQAMPLKAEKKVLEKFGVVPGSDPGSVADAVADANSTAASQPDWNPLAGAPPVPELDLEGLFHAHQRLDAVGAAMTARAMHSLGAFRHAGERHTTEALASSLGVVEAHHQLWETLLELLGTAGYLRREGEGWVSLPAIEEISGRDLEAEAKQLGDECSCVKAHTKLLAACLAEYPRLLRGEVSAPEVMFPGSSMKLVEGVYRGDPLADHLNELAARSAQAFVQGRGGRVRALEVGAGTGGTTGRVLELLEPFADRVEYTYTDVSAGFLRHGRRRFGAKHSNLVYETLDIERDPVEQGFDAAGYDLILASNVLHATRHLGVTLHHVQKLMREGGWLVLSETTAFSPFATLTFGLLDGWWRFEDGADRVKGSPLASIPTWQRLFAANGFGRSTVLGPRSQGEIRVGQQVLVAERGSKAKAVAEPSSQEAPRPTVETAAPQAAAVQVPAAPAPATPVEPLAAPAPPSPASGVSESTLRARLETLVNESISTTLGRDPGDLDPERSFTDYGVDSIILVEMVGALSERLGIGLKTTALFDHPSLRALSDHIFDAFGAEIREHLGAGAAPEAASPAPAPSVPAPAAPAPVSPVEPLAASSSPAPAPGVSESSLRARLEELVNESISTTLGRDPGDLDPERSFTDYGVDSIILVEMVGALSEQLGIGLKTTALFDHPSLRALSDHIFDTFGTEVREHLGASAPAAPTAPAPAASAAPAPVPATPVEPLAAPSSAAPASGASESTLRARLEALVNESISTTLGRDPGDLDPERSFTDYGVDSIILVEMVGALSEQLGIGLKTTALFDHPSLRALSDHIFDTFGTEVREHLGAGAPAAAVESEAVATPAPQTFGGAPVPPGAMAPQKAHVPPTVAAAPARIEAEPARAPEIAPPVEPFQGHQAVVLTRPGTLDQLQLQPCEVPQVGPDEVLIEVRAFSLNFGDLLCVKGLYPTMPEYPFTPGFEVSGTVLATGSEVVDLQPGAEVMALMGPRLGGHSTVVCVPRRFVVDKPAGVSHEEACAFPIVFVTAQHVLERAELDAGEKILIQTAAGGVGLVAVQLARQLGAEIFATASSETKLAHLRSLGVQHTINYQEEDFAEKVRELTDGYGVDVVLNTLSGDAIQKGLDLLAPNGRYVEIAVGGLRGAQNLSLANLVQNQTFFSIDLRRLFMAKTDRISGTLETMRQELAAGRVVPTISHTFELSQIREAYACLENRGNIGKVVVRLPGDPRRKAPTPIPSSRPTPSIPKEPVRQARGPLTGFRSANRPSASDRRLDEREPQPVGTSKIAVIGLACRYPGATSYRQLWENLRLGRSAIREVPSERWDVGRFFDADPAVPGKTYCRWGGFLDDVDRFDPLFFNLSGREAELMDPQQRLFLQESWRALEDAGYGTDGIANARCGVFAGVGASDYLSKLHEEGHIPNGQSLMGNESSMLPARISYLLNLKGPSLAINTACSSSLVALHLACQSIQTGQCDMALAGGVFISLTPDFFISSCKAGMLSPDGQCKTFDNGANGFVPGEGVGVVVLKPLEAAQRDGDHIYGVVLATDTNQDGKTNGITAPSTLSQTSLQRSVFEKAGVSAATIGLVEAHGTGTKLGDPIEIEALTNSFADSTERKQFCAIGSIKTNIGHTCAAAGVAGVIKALLAIHHEEIPPSLNFEQPNDNIDFSETPFSVATESRAWRRGGSSPRRALISSFGFSGTNAEALLEEAPVRSVAEVSHEVEEPRLILVSAKTEDALRQRIDELTRWIEAEGHQHPLASIAYTLHAGRQQFPWRLAGVVDSHAGLLRFLREARDGEVQRPVRLTAAEQRDWNERLHAEAGDAGDRVARRSRLDRLAELYGRGVELAADLLYDRGQRLSLPTYPFARERYWPDGSTEAAKTSAPTPAQAPVEDDSAAGYPLLRGDAGAGPEQRFVFEPAAGEPLVSGHVVQGQEILAAALTLELARAAGAATLDDDRLQLHRVVWRRPLTVSPGAGVEIRLRPENDEIHFELDGAGSSERLPCVAGWLRSGSEPSGPGEAALDLDAIRARCGETISGPDSYEGFEKLGLRYGSIFRVLQDLQYSGEESLARLELPADQPADPALVLHPALLDGALQSTLACHLARGPEDVGGQVPYELRRLDVYGPLPRTCFAHAHHKEGSLDLRLTDANGQVLVALHDLRVARIGEASAPAPRRVFFRPEWRATAVTAHEGRQASGILVLAPDAETAAPLREQAAPAPVVVVTPGAGFERTGSRDYTVAPDAEDDLGRLLDALAPDEKPGSVLVLWSNSALGLPAASPDLDRGFYTWLRFARHLLGRRLSGPVGLGVVYPVVDGRGPVDLAALGALAKSLRAENPDLRGFTLGLPAGAGGRADISRFSEQILAEGLGAAAGAPSIEVRYDGEGQRFEKALAEVPASSEAAVASLRTDGTYLITGGIGGLGLVIARQLAGPGARLLLVGRSAPTLEGSAELDRLRAMGATVLFEQADVTDRVALEQAIERGRRELGPLHGVFHIAGVVNDAFVLHKTDAAAAEVLAPKIDGALALDAITRDDPLDAFVLFSTFAAVSGHAGQTDYAYANAFLDELAAERDRERRAGRRSGRTVAINWPLWRNGTMQPSAAQSQALAGLGLEPFDDAEGFLALREALTFGEPQVVALQGRPEVIRRSVGAGSQAPAPEATGPTADVAGESAKPGLETASPSMDAEELEAATVEFLKELLAEELRVPASRIDPIEPLETYGIDSVMVMNLSRCLEEEFGELSKTLFFEYQTLGELAGYFADRHRETLEQRFRKPEPEPLPVEDVPVAEAPAAPVIEARTEAPAVAPLVLVSEKDRIRDREAEASSDAIAIIGISGRYPLADDLDAFWENLATGRDCITEIPAERWSLEGFFSAEREAGKSYSKWGGFLEGIDKFDPLFFKISPFEADMIDPQERLFLETVWHLLEDAGHTRRSLRDAQTGVFVGVMYGHYQLLAANSADGRMPMSSYASIANRVSYFFDFDGPSIALDTMCSSSLTAIHQACESLKRGECKVAVAGGVNLSVHPRKYLQLSLGRFASSDGRCRSFGEGGDGYVPGEGVGAVLLKPLDAALADGDNVQAVIRGSSINHGAKTNGYTVPNPRAQERAISKALEQAKIDVSGVSYIEAHGTGTSLGDPIEIAALNRAYAELEGGSCPIGSVKSSIGHLESAAGIAAVTKVVLQMQHHTLVPSLHAESLNPNIDFASSPFYVQRRLGSWDRRSEVRDGDRVLLPRIAGISSFGAGGSNAHVVVEAFDGPEAEAVDGPQLVVLSTRSGNRLEALAGRLADHLASRSRAESPWQERLSHELLRHAEAVVGVREGDIGPDDLLDECGFDDVLRTQLLVRVSEAFDLVDSDLPVDFETVTGLMDLLLERHDAQLRAALGGSEVPRLPAPRLVDVAYTLQIGRESMDDRLALVAGDLEKLVAGLRAFVSGTPDPSTTFVGRLAPGEEAPQAERFAGTAGRAELLALAESGDLRAVGTAWVEGADVDWSLIASDRGRRISLPGYPFARERHWLGSPTDPSRPTVAEGDAESRTITEEEPLTSDERLPTPDSKQENDMAQMHTAGSGAQALPLSSTPERLDPAELHSLLVADLVAPAAQIIGLESARLDPKINLGDFGFESVAVKDLAERISEHVGFEISPAMFFDRPNLDALAGWLLEEYEERIEALYRQPEPPAVTGPTAVPNGGAPVVASGSDAGIQSTAPETAEPIAIIGMSGRFPRSGNVQAFWENLREEQDLITEIPEERWDWKDFDNEEIPEEQRCKFHWGGFIDDADKFDPLFFGISPAEAEVMDPQQRVFLQVAWKAIEDSGYRPSDLAGGNVGLFAGVQFSDYQHLLQEAGILSAQSGIGNEHSIMLNRISFLLNFRGPSEPVNTACSSALVAVHRAVRSLRSGESTLALAGGIALNLSPASTISAGMMGILSPDGRCKTLAAGANGYVKGEGAGVFVLKPLRQAEADGDHIYAVIRGTAVNHGGRASSLTAPNSEAQATLVRTAVEEAEVAPETIGYIELHGTGTELGDPVEINGLRSAFRQMFKSRGEAPPSEAFCGIGSVKTNVGHLEPASGVAGMMKVILGMQHETLPGMLHLEEVNPYIDLEGSPFYIVDKTQPWHQQADRDGRLVPRRAGVSSFGFGGVNSHVILEEYRPEPAPRAVGAGAGSDQVLVFSAKSEESLDAMLRRFVEEIDHWQQNPKSAPSLADVAYTLQVGREPMEFRLACVARDFEQLKQRLEPASRGEAGGQGVFRGQVETPGQGGAGTGSSPEGWAEQWVAGHEIDWSSLPGHASARRVPLPTYVFSDKRYWFTIPEGLSLLQLRSMQRREDYEDEILTSEKFVYEELRDLLLDKLKLEEGELEDHQNLLDFGIDSILGAMLIQSIQEAFGGQVSLTALMDHPTLDSLWRYVHDEVFDGEVPSTGRRKRRRKDGEGKGSKKPAFPPELLPINTKGSRQISFWVHGAAGYSAWFQNLSEAIGPEYPIYAFQAKGTDGFSVPQMLDEMVDHYVSIVRMVQPEGPYFIGGYSFGGVIAFEMARKLHSEGEKIRHLVMFDTYPATQEVFDRHFGFEEDFLQFYLANYSLRIHENPELAIRRSDVEHLPPRLRLAHLAQLVHERGNNLISTDDIYKYLRGGLACSDHAEGIYQMYEMKPYEGSGMLFFQATDGFTGRASAAYWEPQSILGGYDYVQPWRDVVVAGEVEVVELDNDHLNMLEDPTLTKAAKHIEALLKEPPAMDMDEFYQFKDSFEEVTRFGHQLLADRFRESGVFPEAGAATTREELHEALGVIPVYNRLFNASIDILEREGYLQKKGKKLVVQPALEEQPFAEAESDIATRTEDLQTSRPEIKDYLPLLTTCQGSVLEVMAGRQDPTDVMFPGGSMELVAELYKGNFQTDFYNRMVAERVLEHVRHQARRYPHSKVQVFEVGAGTGGTSVFVFEALENHADSLRYLYTDVGAAFVQMSRQQFGQQYPYIDFLTYDTEKSPEMQGFEPHSMDVVIASNVLHTTRRIDRTLEQCYNLLKPGGVLVINELTQRLDFNTLTFGLTEGWWLYEDEEDRIQGTPLLLAKGWEDALTQAGFADVEIEGMPGIDRYVQAQCMIAATRATRPVPQAVDEAAGTEKKGREKAVTAGKN